MVRSFEIHKHSYTIAQDAIRDILFMYYDMNNFQGFGQSIERGRFDPYWFLNVVISEPGYLFDNDVKILREGSAVKILSWANDEFYEHSLTSLSGDPWESLVSSEALSHLPPAEKAMKEALKDHAAFEDALQDIYKRYVLAEFRRLAGR